MSPEQPEQTDLRARICELEATVRGLTQELVDANERIRQLEEFREGREGEGGGQSRTDRASGRRRGNGAGDGVGDGDVGRNGTSGSDRSTTQMAAADQADDETASDLDDIIVA